MFQMDNSVFCCSNAGGSGSGSLTARHSPTCRTCVWDHFILNADNVNCKHCYDVLKIKKRAPWNHLKRRIQRSPWQDMKRHTKYNDPVRNYGALSSFYQMIVIKSIHFTILPLALYLDKKTFSLRWGSWRFEWHLHILSCRWLYATAIDAFCSS